VNDRRTLVSLHNTKYAVSLIGLVSITALVACFSPDRKTVLLPSKDSFNEIKKDVVAIRGIVLKRDIEIAALGIDRPSHTIFRDSADDSGIARLEHAYKQVGLLGTHDDLKAALEKFHRLDRLVSYDSANARVIIAADAATLGGQLTAPYTRSPAELAIAGGIVQALQEQHFQWQEKINQTVVEDARLAYRAVAGGDALLTALAYASDGNLSAANHLAAARQISLQMARLARGLPPFLQSQLVFPLAEGSNFVAWAAKAKGRDGLNALYANPPAATAQILHPDRYYLVAQTPQRFFPAGLFRFMESSALFEQSFGEYLLRGLLQPENSPAAASGIAAGWRGDQLFSFADSGFQTTAWYSVWDSADEAAAFLRAFQTVAEKRQRMRLRARKNDETLIANARDRGSFALARKDNMVLYLVTESARLAATVEAAWRDLVLEAEPEVLRFDSARGPFQLSLVKR
jgi:hypothetical protein